MRVDFSDHFRDVDHFRASTLQKSASKFFCYFYEYCSPLLISTCFLFPAEEIVLYFSCLYLTKTYNRHAGYSVQEANQRHLSHLVLGNGALFSQVPTLELRHKSGHRVPVCTPFLLVLGKSCTALYTLLSSCFKMALNRV